jgi:two-component system sensor histidine kinase TctE
LERRIDLGFEAPEAPVLVHGDPVLLRELVKNLLDNAIRYTQTEGAVTVRVAADRSELTALLEVRDNGPGIAESERGLVFERFYRILGSGSDGSGLGLAIVREIALQHNAQVTLTGAPTVHDPKRPGTIVGVRFPLAAEVPTRFNV